MQSLEENIRVCCEKHPTFVISKIDEGYILNGTYILNATFNEVPLYDEYYLEIFIPNDYPKSIPLIKDKGGTVPKELEHFLDDGSFCLGACCEIVDAINLDESIEKFLDTFLVSYLYMSSYFIRYGKLPFTARSHGVKGIEEAYAERYNCTNRAILMKLLLYLSRKVEFRGHVPCDCGSGKRLRCCHGKKVLEDLKSRQTDYYKNDAITILVNYFGKKEG